MADRPTILLNLEGELKPDKIPFIGMSAEWTRRLYELIGGQVSSEITVANTWAQATIRWRGQHFVILMTNSQEEDLVDCIDCTKPGGQRRRTVVQAALLWECVFKPILRNIAQLNVVDWQKKLELIMATKP